MKLRYLAAALLAGAFALAMPASANIVTDDFSAVGVSGPPFQLNLDISYDTSQPNSGGYNIVGLSGEVNGQTVTGLVGTNPGTTASNPTGNTQYQWDNILNTAAPYFDNNGLLGSTATSLFNIYTGVGGAPTYSFTSQYPYDQGPGTVITGTLSPVPEPLTVSLFAAGLIGAIVLARRKGKQNGISFSGATNA